MSDNIKNIETMVICSTMNQMVNYIPIKEHSIKNVCNIKITSNDKYKNKFNADEWDGNLTKSLDIEFEDIVGFNSDEISDHESIMKKLSDYFNDKPQMLWNITGGQRHIIMAITEYVFNNRPQDYLVYFEGDEEKYYYYSKHQENVSADIKCDKYDLDIPIALKLMGFEMKNTTGKYKYYKFLLELKDKQQDKTSQTYKEYEYFNKLYDEYCKKQELRDMFVVSNRIKLTKEKEILVELLEMINDNQKLSKEVKKLFIDNNKEVLLSSLENLKNGVVFGYILERMTFYKILKTLILKNCVDKIADIDLSVKVNPKSQNDNKVNDELDIVILTKMGKLIVFECKSGGMTGDDAKSTSYTTYRLSGVYGTPILLSPIESTENPKKAVGLKSSKQIKDIYDNIKSARNSAQRALLDVLSIYDIEKKIDKII